MIEKLKNHFTKSIDTNYAKLANYFPDNLDSFTELNDLKQEILFCLLLNLNQASICLTNHFLERLLKLALIKNYKKGVDLSSNELYNQKVSEANKEYDHLPMSKVIDLALKEKIIDEEIKQKLHQLRKTYRNPYSHAQISEINKDISTHMKGYLFNLDEIISRLQTGQSANLPNQPVKVPTISPFLAQLYQTYNADPKANSYFIEVYTILVYLENKFKK